VRNARARNREQVAAILLDVLRRNLMTIGSYQDRALADAFTGSFAN
jgi:hypothetical protein